jgi:hypothetical protein
MIRQVWLNKWVNPPAGQLLVTIPHTNDSSICEGDYVEIRRAEPESIDGKCTYKGCGKLYKDHTIRELVKHGMLKVKKNA